VDLDLKIKGKSLSLLDDSRLSILGDAIDQTDKIGGEIWECGCWRGGASLWMKGHLSSNRTIRLFDTFCGIPVKGIDDKHPVGSFGDTDYQKVVDLFSGLDNISIHRGVIPLTFKDLDNCIISVVHIDVDQHDAVRDCLSFVYPRMPVGGWVIIDDYGCPNCPGARRAVDEFLIGKQEVLIWGRGYNPQARFIKV
jgi:O-methyltransferase